MAPTSARAHPIKLKFKQERVSLMINKKWILICAMLVGAASSGSHAADDSTGWSFMAEPYVLASTIDGEASIGRITGADVDMDFGDILKVLDLGAMVHLEAIRENTWGVVLDYGFMDLSNKVTTPRDGVLEAEVRQGVMEAFLLRRFQSGPSSLDVFAGIRWWDNDIGATVDLALLPGERSRKIKQDWVDPVIGARWTHPLSERWELTLRGDVGGFGVASDFSATAMASAKYAFNSTLALELAYKALWVDYEDGTRQTPGYFAYDTVTHGPLIGLIIAF
jgi:hypothetical protein